MALLQKTRFEGVFTDAEGNIYTENLTPGKAVYDEKLVADDTTGKEYRQWSITRSKLGAYIARGPSVFPFSNSSVVLYLGAASGTTCSHVSDICISGRIFAVEFSPRPFRDLLKLAECRKNLFPILEDARHPERYSHIVPPVDVLFQDIAQRDQTAIFLKNVRKYLKKKGIALLSLKARSVDSAAEPEVIFDQTRKELESCVKILEVIDLSPFEKDHSIFAVQY